MKTECWIPCFSHLSGLLKDASCFLGYQETLVLMDREEILSFLFWKELMEKRHGDDEKLTWEFKIGLRMVCFDIYS
ncbi:TPA: hypothetical protein JA361_05000 [Legionella pneumophila]|nr:hypothetical protein [Legionella pneumophila]